MSCGTVGMQCINKSFSYKLMLWQQSRVSLNDDSYESWDLRQLECSTYSVLVYKG